MKTALFGILTMFVFSGFAHASSSTYLDSWRTVDYKDISVAEVEYQVNPEIGTARLHITYASYGFERGGDETAAPFGVTTHLVRGLRFDRSTSQVVFTDSRGVTTVCGQGLFRHGLFKDYWEVTATGRCGVKIDPPKFVVKEWDDGFHTPKYEPLTTSSFYTR